MSKKTEKAGIGGKLGKILMGKGVFRVLTVAAAAGVPIACLWEPGDGDTLSSLWPLSQEGAAEAGPLQGESSDESRPPISLEPGAVRGVEGAPVRSMAEVLRFDVSPRWILSRWPRVSTGLAHLEFQGYRVPLVTGSTESDVAGSLTYYFNPQQQVQRITFRGTTGDVRRLVALLTTRHRFTRRLTNDPGIFLYETVSPAGQPSGVLKVSMSGVVRSNDPYRRFDVDLTMERPS